MCVARGRRHQNRRVEHAEHHGDVPEIKKSDETRVDRHAAVAATFADDVQIGERQPRQRHDAEQIETTPITSAGPRQPPLVVSGTTALNSR
jgi:hypothetical protein